MKALILSLAALLLLSGCGDSTQPNGPDLGGDHFTITALSEDSVHYEEPLWLEFKNGPDSIHELSLFIHTVPIPLDSLVGNRLFFHIPRHTEGATLRLFQHDSILAEGSFALTIFNRTIDSYEAHINSIWPLDGFKGDLININGQDFPPLARNIAVTVNGNACEIASHTSTRIQIYIPEGSGLGDIRLFAFGKESGQAFFSYIDPGPIFLQTDQLSWIGISAAGLVGKFRITDLTGSTSPTINDTSILGGIYADRLTTTRVQHIGDSLILDAKNRQGRDSSAVELRLHSNEQENSISGTITIYILTERGTEYEKEVSLLLHVSNLRWREAMGYDLYAFGPEIQKKITKIEYSYRSEAEKLNIELLEYTGATIDGNFTITID